MGFKAPERVAGEGVQQTLRNSALNPKAETTPNPKAETTPNPKPETTPNPKH